MVAWLKEESNHNLFALVDLLPSCDHDIISIVEEDVVHGDLHPADMLARRVSSRKCREIHWLGMKHPSRTRGSCSFG